MTLNINKEVVRMKRMSTGELREQFESVCGEPPRSHNRDWLVKKIAWRMQANDEGGLPARVRQRALAMADDSDLRKRPPQAFVKQIEAACEEITVVDPGRDPRLPLSGDTLQRTYKGQSLIVNVRDNDFEFNGEIYPTLSDVAKAISGSHVNGFTFFKLNAKKEVSK